MKRLCRVFSAVLVFGIVTFLYRNKDISTVYPRLEQPTNSLFDRSKLQEQADGNVEEPPHESHREVMLARYRTVEELCPKEDLVMNWTATRHLLYSKYYKFSYCFVPKIACTFWKTVVHLVENPDVTPEEFTRSLLIQDDHNVHAIKLPFYGYLNCHDRVRYLRSRKAILFTRDPFTRLFSAYVNKFVLPFFWDMVRIFSLAKAIRPNALPESIKCGHDVTFEEFLRYVIHVDDTGDYSDRLNEDHWSPVSSVCDVCQMKYDYIGKQESFAKDRDFIFQELGLSKLMLSNITISDRVRFSINQTLLPLKNKFKHSTCITRWEMLNRIWYSLQTQGFVGLDSVVPWKDLDVDSLTFSDVIDKILLFYDQNKPTSQQIKERRSKTLVDAYRTVSLHVKQGIQRVFHYDFLLFGYDKEPPEVFNEM